MKKQALNLVLNEIKKTDDPTIIPCTYIIMDFDKSHNNKVVDKKVALEGGKTLINKPIVAKYNEVEEANTPTDNFGSHEERLAENRYGETIVKTGTTPIGVFTTEGYLTTINVNGKPKEVMAADAVMWYSRFSDAIDLLLEWHNKGVKINASCEYLYANYSFKDGIEYHHSPIYFEGHALLASENRGEQSIVRPAYDSASLLSVNDFNKFNRLVAQASQENEQKEDEKMPEQELEKVEATETEVQVSEEVVEETVVEATEAKETVEEKVEESQPEETENAELEELKTELSQLKEANTKLQEQFNTATEKLTQLNSLVEELKPFKEKFETEKLEKAINEKKDYYSVKFEALNATEKFGTEEVQDLIVKSVNESDEGKQAILQLNSMLVDLVDVVTTKETPIIKEMASKRENLLPADDSFDSRYSL